MIMTAISFIEYNERLTSGSSNKTKQLYSLDMPRAHTHTLLSVLSNRLSDLSAPDMIDFGNDEKVLQLHSMAGEC